MSTAAMEAPKMTTAEQLMIGNQSGDCLWKQDVTEAGIRYATFLVDHKENAK